MFKLGKKAPKLFQTVADEAFADLGLEGDAFVEAEFVSRGDIRKINAETRGIDSETDVLSFPMLDEILPFTKKNYRYDYDPEVGAVRIGSIIICKDIAKAQAEEFGHGQRREEAYLFLHGLLHLLEYDHIDEDGTRRMREAEERILNKLNIKRSTNV